MRFPTTALFAVTMLLLGAWGAVCPASAQQQDRKLEERIMRPNMDQSFLIQRKRFSGGRSFSGGGTVPLKKFGFLQGFRTSSYSTKGFAGQKSAWMGDFKYQTTKANPLERGLLPGFIRKYATRGVPVKSSSDAGKRYDTTASSVANARGVFRGRSQDKIDKLGPQALNEIQSGTFTELKTMDDIRKLLNEN